MIIVRLLLFLALASIGAALLLWLVKRDRRYLRFIGLTIKFTVLVLLGILLWFAAERLLAPILAPLVRRGQPPARAGIALPTGSPAVRLADAAVSGRGRAGTSDPAHPSAVRRGGGRRD